MKRLVLITVGIFLGFVVCGAAQCPNRETVYQKLLIIEKLSDRQALIKTGTELTELCQRCRMTSDSVYAKLLHTLGRAYWKEGDLPKASELTRLAIAINQVRSAFTREANLANSFTNLGLILTDQGNPTAALLAFDQSVQIARRYPDKYFVGAMSLEKKATLYYQQGDYSKASQSAEQGFLLAQRANDPLRMVQNLVQKVQALTELGEYKTAETLLKKAVLLAQTLNNPTLLANLFSLTADLHRVLKQYTSAIPYYQKAFQVNREADYRYGCAQTLTNLGFLYFKNLKDFPKALQLYQQALEYTDAPDDRARIIDNIGDIYKQKKDYPQALSFFQQALQTHSIGFSSKNPSTNPASDAIRRVAQKEYLYSLVLNKAETWLDWARTTNNHTAYLRNALKTYALADTMIDFMRWEHTGQQSKLFWRDKTHAFYEQAIETSFRLNDAASALRFFEKSRAVLLNDKLNELGAKRQLSPEQTTEEQRFRQLVTDWQNRLATEAPNTPEYTRTLDSLHIVQEQQEAFIRKLERSNPGYYRYKYDNAMVSLTQVQEQLTKRKASLVTYFVGDSTLYALAITPTRTRFHQIPASVYTRLASELLTLNANPDAQNQQFNHYLRISSQLYQQLLAPLQLTPGRVILSPDGVLLPFDALSRSATQPDFLVKHHAFSYAYSINRLFKETPATPGGFFDQPGPFLGMAPVRFSPRLNQISLRGSDAALQRIGQHFSSPTLLTGQAATRHAFSKQASHYRVVQLFTHAEADSTGHEPALFFADSTLRLSELASAGLLPTELVGLSACKTGIGANQRGEGVFSLARGFASIGVPSILTTLWNVENQATYALTERFYAYLAEGLPKDQALQQAKLDYLASADLSGQLPNQWAGLLLVGNAEPLQTGWKTGFWRLILALFIVSGLGVWIWRRNTARSRRSKKNRNIVS